MHTLRLFVLDSLESHRISPTQLHCCQAPFYRIGLRCIVAKLNLVESAFAALLLSSIWSNRLSLHCCQAQSYRIGLRCIVAEPNLAGLVFAALSLSSLLSNQEKQDTSCACSRKEDDGEFGVNALLCLQ
jgi:hypothetical protein